MRLGGGGVIEKLVNTVGIGVGVGFTQINVVLDGGGSVPNTQTPTAQQGSGYSGTGSRVIYVSNSTGNDSNTGTLASPVATKAHALTLLRPGSPDQMLCKCRDTWPASDDIGIPASGGGANAGVIGQVCTGPWLLGFYGTGNRPLHNVSAATSGLAVVRFSSGNANYIAIIGWEFYAPGRDPTASTYNQTDVAANVQGVNTTNTNGDWILIEDCRASFMTTGLELQAASTTPGTDGAGNKINTASGGRQYLRRCLVYRSWSTNTGPLGGGDAQGVFISNISSPTLDSNCIAYSGWDPLLVTPQVATVISSTFTWPISSYAFNALPFPNNAVLYVSATAGGLTVGTAYHVINANSGAGTFQLSTTQGGSAVTVSNGSYTLMWNDPALNQFNHSVYMDATCTTNNGNISNNLFLFGGNVMQRCGGTFAGNFLHGICAFGAYFGIQVGEGESQITTFSTLAMNNNVIQHPNNCIQTSAQFSTTEGGIGTDVENANGSTGNILVTNNIYSMSTTSVGAGIFNFCHDSSSDIVQDFTVTGNIFYNWNESGGVFQTNGNTGTGNVTSPNVIDGVTSYPASNTEGYLHPLRDLTTYDSDTLSGPGTVADVIAQIIGTTPGSGRALQTWPTNLTPQGVVAYIRQGFGL